MSTTATALSVLPVPPAPLSRERLTLLAAAEGWHHRIGPEGELRTTLGLDEVSLHQRGPEGEVLLVRATWHVSVGAGLHEALRLLLEEHHLRGPWPQARTEVLDGGTVVVRTSQAVSAAAGLTDEQLRRHVLDATDAAQALFHELGAALGLDGE